MKRRRVKTRFRREMREIRRSQVRELGDHRRWMWTANPETFRDETPALDGMVPYRFDPVWGRMWTMTPGALARLAEEPS